MKRFLTHHHTIFSNRFPAFSSVIKNIPKDHQMATAGEAFYRRQKKVVIIMGPTGSGKSKLSIDLATRFFPKSEVINSDKIQVYRGLDITTNKIQMHERRGVPHRLLGEFDPKTELTPSEFRSLGSKTIAQVTSRRQLPLLVGGSNSFIHSLLARRFNQNVDVFDESNPVDSFGSELRYKCCFLWVDVSMPVLTQYLNKRVDYMLDSGMFEELTQYFDSEGFAESDSAGRTGLRKAIGVPEFERYFKRNGKERRRRCHREVGADVEERLSYEEAVREIKENTCQLAKRQLAKILRLRDAGWDLHKIDATVAFRAAMMTPESGKLTEAEIWEKQVVQPSMKIVKQFLNE